MDVKVFIITWLTFGVVSSLLSAFKEYRGKDKECLFDGDGIYFLILVIGGYASFVIYLFQLLNKPVCKLMYKIANIGVKKENK